MSAGDGILVSVNDGVMTLTIDRPESLNSLHPAAHHRLGQLFDDFACDETLQLAVITGNGEKAFCVGSDLKARAALGGDDMPPSGFGGITERFDLRKPVIAAINGHAIGGGMEIVLACDIAIAVSTAKFGLPEVKVGLAAAGGLHRLARQLPMKQAMALALTGDLISADEALSLGLINEVVAPGDLPERTVHWVNALRQGAPLSLQASKEMMLKGLDQSTLEAAFAARYPSYEKMLESEDAVEGSQAFIEKRKPSWKGR